MNFVDQPSDLLIEQMILLDVEDLLNLCEVDHHIRDFCSRPDLWRRKLQLEFPDQPIGSHPREEYLNLVQQRAYQRLEYALTTGFSFELGGLEKDFVNPESWRFTPPHSRSLQLEPISGLRQLKINYELPPDNSQLIEYKIDRPITPLDVMRIVESFYQQPLMTRFPNGTIGQLGNSRIKDLGENKKSVIILRDDDQWDVALSY